MSDEVRTTFPVMGSEGIASSVVNMSGARSPYTQLAPRQGVPSGDDLPSATGARSQTMTNAEVLGPCCAPQTTLFYPNAADHASTGRNVKLMPSRSGVSDFWNER